MSNYLSIRECAEQFGVHPDTVRHAIRTGRLKAHRVGIQIRIFPENARAYIEANEVTMKPRKSRARQPNEPIIPISKDNNENQ